MGKTPEQLTLLPTRGEPQQTSLYTGHWVDGAGPLDAEILLVGQAPGAFEAARGEPFVGPAGQMLRSCVHDAGLDWNHLRRTNVVRCRPPGNRPPTIAEIKEYLPWLMEEVSSMPRLRVIVALGNEAMLALLRRGGIAERRGEEVAWGNVTVLPTFHPAYVLRASSQRPVLVQDLTRAARLARGEPLSLPARSIRFGERPVVGPLAAVDVETDEHDQPRLFAVGSHPDHVTVVDAARAHLAAIPWESTRWVGHNLRADQHWLRRIGIELGRRREDTMLMAHLLNENRRMGLKKLALEVLDPEVYWRHVEPFLKRPEQRGAIPFSELGEYCAHDVAATLLLYDRFRRDLDREPRLERLYRHVSLPLSDVLLEVEERGVLLDTGGADRLRAQLAAGREQVEGQMGYPDVNWNSGDQVAALLYDRLGITPPRDTESGKRGATDEGSLRKIIGQHPVVGLLLRWRKAAKQEQIITSWLKRARADGRVFPSYNQVGTVTGRLSGRDPNPQNVPADSAVRQLVIAPPGMVLLTADYSTIELAVGAWLFDEERMLDAYLAGRDLHTETAGALLGRPPASTEERRKYGKVPNFGLLYQQGDLGFMEYAAKLGVQLTLEEAANIRARWHNLYPGVRQGWQRYARELSRHGHVESPSGRRRRLPEFNAGSSTTRNEAWRQGCNFPVQCTATEFTHVAAILAAPTLRSDFDAHMILHVHDSVVFEVPAGQAREAAAALRYIMESEVPRYFELRLDAPIPIPLRVEVSVGSSWGLTSPVHV